MYLNRQLIIYLSVGVASAVVDIGGMQLIICSGIHYSIAVTVGFVAGLIFNYLLHAKVTFKSSGSTRSFVRYSIIVLLNYVLTLLCVYASEYFFQSALLGKVASLPLVAVIGYLLGRHWIFKT